MEHLDRFLAALVQSVAQSAPWLVIGYMVAALVREWMPAAMLTRWFSPRGVVPVLRAGGVGLLMPLCSCTVIPVGVGLARSGAAPGTVLTFLMTAPTLSPVAIVLAITLFGPLFASIFIVSALVGAIVLGLIGNRLLPAAAPSACPPPIDDRRGWRERMRSAGRWAFRDLAPELSLDLVIGLTIAAAVLALLPMAWIGSWLGKQEIATLFYVILLGIPTYTCTVPSLPVVQSLLLAGMSPGAGIAYLLAGPATNLGELLVLRRNLGARAMWLLIAGLGGTALAGGLIADHLIFANYAYVASPVAGQIAPGCCVASFMPISARPETALAAMAMVPRWHWPFVAVLAATVIAGLVQRRVRRRQHGDEAAAATAEPIPAGAT